MLSYYKRKFATISLSNEYFIFSLVIFLTIFMLSAFLYCYSYSAYVNDKNQTLNRTAESLQEELESIFEENRTLLNAIGLKISSHAHVENLDVIADLLVAAKNLNQGNKAISNISWLNTYKKVVVNNTGVLKNNLLSMHQRSFFKELSEKPWILQILQSDRSPENNDEPILQLAMGVENKNGEHLGYLTLSLKIKAIIERLRKISKSNSADFTLIDDRNNLIFDSSKNLINQTYFGETQNWYHHLNNQKPVQNFIKKDALTSRVQTLKRIALKQKTPEPMNYLQNLYYKKIKCYPHIILVSFNKSELERELHQHIFPKLYGFIFAGLFCISVLYFFRKRIITPLSHLSQCAILISKGKTDVKIPKQSLVEMFNLAKSLIWVKHYIKKMEVYKEKLELANETIKQSSDAIEDFIQSLNKELMVHLKEILICTEILLKEKSEQESILFDTEATIKYIEKIRESAINIKHKTSNSLNLTWFDFNHIIDQAVQINLKHSILKKIEIKVFLSETPVEMYGDALKLKQILVGLIFQSIENSTENQIILVSNRVCMDKDNTYTQITIKDYSFGLSEEELQRVKRNIGWHNENYLFTNIDTQFVKKLVSMHQGEFNVTNKLNEGRIVLLTFPLLKEKDFSFIKEKNNVYYLYPENGECSVADSN